MQRPKRNDFGKQFWGASCGRLGKAFEFETDLKNRFLQDYEHLVCFHRTVGCRNLPALVESERKRVFIYSEHLVNLSTDLHSATFCY